MAKTCARPHSARIFYAKSAYMNWKTLCIRNTPCNELLKGLCLLVFYGFPKLPFQKQDFSCSGGPKWDPPVTFELKVREQNQLGFWNISIRPTSGASFIKIGRPTFSTSGTLSQTMTLNKKEWKQVSSVILVILDVLCCHLFQLYDK